MTLPRTVADVPDRHVTFEFESIDRMYCNVYQPRLQYPRGAAAFFSFHRGHTFASSALMPPMTKMFVTAIHDFVDRHELDLVHFTKGQRKDDLTQSYLAGHDGTEGVLYVGQAQEKASVMRTERRYDSRAGASYPLAGQGLRARQLRPYLPTMRAEPSSARKPSGTQMRFTALQVKRPARLLHRPKWIEPDRASAAASRGRTDSPGRAGVPAPAVPRPARVSRRLRPRFAGAVCPRARRWPG
jgi:hypothetical protein